jgi:hypothetical protein
MWTIYRQQQLKAKIEPGRHPVRVRIGCFAADKSFAAAPYKRMLDFTQAKLAPSPGKGIFRDDRDEQATRFDPEQRVIQFEILGLRDWR